MAAAAAEEAPQDEWAALGKLEPSQVVKTVANYPRHLFYISRSKNQNIVVYEAKGKDAGKGSVKELDKAYPVAAYWLKIEPSYREANRASGKLDDRVGLNILEQKMAYGVSTNNVSNTTCDLSLVACPSKALRVVLDSASGRAQAECTLNEKACRLVFIYVDSTERLFGLLPQVNYVELTGVTLPGGERVVERIVP